jgi:flagella basal body P-ring formation protein FlgA
MLCSVVSWTAAQASMPAANSLESLHRELRQWVASTQGVEPDSVQVATGDARLRIPTCEKPVQFDYPFSNRQNVRARCEQPNWQHYLQISLRNGTTTSPAVPGAIGLVPRQVLVSPQMLKRGTVLQPGMLKTAEVAMPPSESQVLPPQQSVSNMELVRDLPANTPLRSYDLKPSLLVRRGQQVLVNVGEGRGFLITVRAEAQQDGMLGEQIRLKNTESGRLLSAVVTGVNLARGL